MREDWTDTANSHVSYTISFMREIGQNDLAERLRQVYETEEAIRGTEELYLEISKLINERAGSMGLMEIVGVLEVIKKELIEQNRGPAS